MSDYNEKILSRINTSLNDIQWKDILNIQNSVKVYNINNINECVILNNGSFSDVRAAIYNDVIFQLYAHVTNLQNMSSPHLTNYIHIGYLQPNCYAAISYYVPIMNSTIGVSIQPNGELAIPQKTITQTDIYFNLIHIIQI